MIQGPYPYLMDPRMKKALEKVAEKEFSSIPGILKKSADEYLHENGIDWQEEESGD